jgi:hypothetical protein
MAMLQILPRDARTHAQHWPVAKGSLPIAFSAAPNPARRWALRAPTPIRMACPEGLEPPTCCLEGSCSIQLSYGQRRVGSTHGCIGTLADPPQARSWSGRHDSNVRPTGPKPVALPGCATPRRLVTDQASPYSNPRAARACSLPSRARFGARDAGRASPGAHRTIDETTR